MAVDVSKIRVGDEVTIRVTVKALKDHDGDMVSRSSAVGLVYFRREDIVTHTPTPRPFAISDVVTWGTEYESWTVIAVHAKHAWLCRHQLGATNDECLMVMELDRLRHVDPA